MRRRRRLSGLLLAALLAVPAEVPAADELPREGMRIAILAHRLAAADFAQREQAEAELLSLGPDALPALRGAVHHADLEARYRLLRIIEQLEQRARAAALDAFRTGTPPRDPALLSAWHACLLLTGDSPAARDLFADMVRSEPWLIQALSGPAEHLRELFEQRCADIHLQRMQRQDSQRAVATVAALLLVGRQPECFPSATAVSCLTNCIQEGAFLQAMERPDRPAPLERLVAVWIADAGSSNPQERLRLAAKFDLMEGVDVALQIIRQRLYGPQLSLAVMYLAKSGDRAHLHELELLLDDATELQVHRQSAAAQAGVMTFSSRVQDVALVALLQMTEQNPRDYGFTGLREHPETIYATATIGFESDEQRRAAVAQWKRWSAANLKAVQPLVEQAAAGHST